METLQDTIKISFNYLNNQFEIDYKYRVQETLELERIQSDFNQDHLKRMYKWKVNGRFIKDIFLPKYILDELNSLKRFTSKDRGSKELKESLKRLFDLIKSDPSIKGIKLPMLSTILRFRNPEVFQIIDIRALRAAFYYNPKPFLKGNRNWFPRLQVLDYDIYEMYLEQLYKIDEEGYFGIKLNKFSDWDRFLYILDKKYYKLNEKPNGVNLVNDYLKELEY